MTDQQAFHADMLRLEQYLDDVLRAALLRPLTASEVLDLRLMAGIPDRQAKKAIVQAECTLETFPF